MLQPGIYENDKLLFTFDELKTKGYVITESQKLNRVRLSFGDLFIVPQDITEIADNCFDFSANDTIKEIILPDNLQKIGESSINCMTLERINTPSSLRSIPESAFSFCALKEFDFSNIEEIGSEAFSDNNFKTLHLEKAKSIGKDAFSNNKNLKYVYLDKIEKLDDAFPKNKDLIIFYSKSRKEFESCIDKNIYSENLICSDDTLENLINKYSSHTKSGVVFSKYSRYKKTQVDR